MKASFESIPRQSDSSFIAYRRREPHFAFHWHYHPEIELTYIHCGSGTRLVGDQLSNFEAGDLVLLGPNLPHSWATHEAESEEPDLAAAVVIQFPQAMISGNLEQNPEFTSVAGLLEKAKRGIHFPPATAQIIGPAMSDLLAVPGMERYTRLLLILDRLALAEDIYPLASPLYAPSYGRENEERLDRVFQLLHVEFHRPIPLAEVAGLTHMTETSFSRFFRKMTGRSFSDYLNDLRVSRACQLLTETRQNISEVAFAAGFNSTTHFNRMFLRKKGVAPRIYRIQYQKSKGKLL